MPIKSTIWTVGDKVFATLKEAQTRELWILLKNDESEVSNENIEAMKVVKSTVDNAEAVIRILSVKEKKARSDKGKRHRAALNRELQDMKQ